MPYVLNKDYTGGQGVGPSSYFTTAPDLDSDHTTIEGALNLFETQLAALQGPNALLARDALEINDAAHPGGPVASGVIGGHSLRATVGSPNSEVDVAPGQAIVGGQRVVNASGATFVGSGGTGTRWFNVGPTGTLTQQLSAGAVAGGLDLASATWTGPSGPFSAVVQLARIFFDGDDYDLQRRRLAALGPASPPTFPVRDYRGVNARISTLERIIAGLVTGAEGETLGPKGFGGSFSAPGLITTDGATFDAGTGIYRDSADVIGLAAGGGARMTVAAALVRLFVALRAADGSAALPSLAFFSDSGAMGFFRETTNVLGISTSGVQAARFDAQGNLDLITQSRVKGVRSTAQTIADATITLVDFNAADAFDVGTWHDHASGTLSVRQEFTVPAGADGLYDVLFAFEWASPTNATEFLCEVTVGGSPIPEKFERLGAAAGALSGQLAAVVQLAAGAVVRARVTQNDTGGAGSLDLETASLSICKRA